MKICTQDSDNRPKIELRMQEGISFTDKIRHIPTMMMNMHDNFNENMLFSWYSENCTHVSSLTDKGVIDLDRTKQASVSARNFIEISLK